MISLNFIKLRSYGYKGNNITMRLKSVLNYLKLKINQ